MTSHCHACGRPGHVLPVPALRSTLCVDCDLAFQAWCRLHPFCIPTDWPAWAPLRRAS